MPRRLTGFCGTARKPTLFSHNAEARCGGALRTLAMRRIA
jgi:hypothetical protein